MPQYCELYVHNCFLSGYMSLPCQTFLITIHSNNIRLINFFHNFCANFTAQQIRYNTCVRLVVLIKSMPFATFCDI